MTIAPKPLRCSAGGSRSGSLRSCPRLRGLAREDGRLQGVGQFWKGADISGILDFYGDILIINGSNCVVTISRVGRMLHYEQENRLRRVTGS